MSADIPIVSLESSAIELALFGLINERRYWPLKDLAVNDALRYAAAMHTTDMIANHFFSHTGSDGSQAATRINRAGYTLRAKWWLVGENLVWGTSNQTPRDLMNMWLLSPPHLANIVRPGFVEVGLSAVKQTPWGDAGVTVACEFGHIKYARKKKKRKRKDR